MNCSRVCSFAKEICVHIRRRTLCPWCQGLDKSSWCNISSCHQAPAYHKTRRETVCSCFQFLVLIKCRRGRCKASCCCFYPWYHSASLTAPLQVFHTFLFLLFGQSSPHLHSRRISGWNPKLTGPPIVEQV